MSPIISIKSDYILVEIRTSDYWEILEAVGRLFEMPEYLDKNTIWVFPEGPLKNFTYDDLYKITDFISAHYPKAAKLGKKTALVVKTGLHASMADLYSKIGKDLPYEIGVFSNFQSAEDWIIKGG